jgi:DNA-binding response OmpR family regulator
MARVPHVLVVDDDDAILDLVSMNLISKGYSVKVASNGARALDLLTSETPDLILLDIMMPDLDGLAVCQRVRDFSNVPIIMLSARGEEETKVRALEIGADDYLAKPFGAAELGARVKAVLRRAAQRPMDRRKATLELGMLHLDLVRQRASIGHEEIRLTPIEYRLLLELAKQPNQTVKHDHLLSEVWGPAYKGCVEYLHVYIGHLRRKLSKARGMAIFSQPGVGYMLITPK